MMRVDQLVLGRQHHVGRAEQGVGTRGEDADDVALLDREVDVRAPRAADPVALHQLDRLRPVQRVQVLDQPVPVRGDPHHPLLQVALEDREVAALAAPVRGDLLVGQHRAQAGAPVDRGLADVGQPVVVDQLRAARPRDICAHGVPGVGPVAGLELGDQRRDRAGLADLRVVPGVEDLQEDPLRPPVVLRVGGREAAPVVVRQAQPAQLTPVPLDVGLGGGPRVRAGLHRVLLGGQAERVEAHRVQHVEAGHPLVAGVAVGADVPERVTDVQAGARRVREHVLHVQLRRAGPRVAGVGQVAGRVRRVERAVLGPVRLPARLDLVGQGGGVAERRGL